jgi:lipopolysaccharide export system ATP-binding protein
MDSQNPNFKDTKTSMEPGFGLKGLTARSLNKRWGQRQVLKDVSIEIQRGEAVGLLGPNGAGKTTCFYILCGLAKPNEGQVLLDGTNITNLPLYRRARLGVGYLPQEPSAFRGMTVEGNLMAAIQLVEKKRSLHRDLVQGLLEDFGLNKIRNNTAQSLSGGERRRMEIARALAARPSFLLLDEPLAGIDPVAVGEIRNLIKQLTELGVGVLITDHNVRDTLEVVDRAYILHDGGVMMEGTPEEVIRHDDVRRVYLGDSFGR